jgi:protein-tyrosine phosphatase
MLLLALAGVAPAQVAADYALSADRLGARAAALGEEDPGPPLRAFLADRGTTAEETIVATLAELDVEARLRDARLTDEDVEALRRRLAVPVRRAALAAGTAAAPTTRS